MSKAYKYLIPILTMALFLAVMTGHNLLKRPFGTADDVEQLISSLRADLLEEDWPAAETSLAALQQGWKMVVRRVQFSVERDEINLLNANLARIRGFLQAREKGGALAELAEVEEHWDNLGK